MKRGPGRCGEPTWTRHSARAVFALFFLLGSVAAFAHEGHIHALKGTVAGFHADMHMLEVKTVSGTKQTVALNATTKYVRGTVVATSADLKPGTRVVVLYKEDGATKTATEVKIGTVSKVPAPQAARPSPKPSPSPGLNSSPKR